MSDQPPDNIRTVNRREARSGRVGYGDPESFAIAAARVLYLCLFLSRVATERSSR